MTKTKVLSDTLLFEDYEDKLQITSLSNNKHIICIVKNDYKDLKRFMQNAFTYKQ